MKQLDFERFSGRHFRGFTILELLIVVGILSLLAALLMPAMSSARKKGQQIHCMNNLRQIGMAHVQYANDWEERIVPGLEVTGGAYWEQLLEKQCGIRVGKMEGHLFWCPANKETPLSAWMPKEFFCANMNYTRNSEIDRMLYGSIPDPTRTVMVADGKVAAPYAVITTIFHASSATNRIHFSLHGGRANCLFVDGHVEGIENLKDLIVKP
ncbi:MAG: prepilin-type N-terminal cleavage/methylation domain-containing protein [Verrucomicrobiae bacterium]|nr:prepilin-type N-terminal cleavage/methylation domain-containing protein [Verrucomicrobiae bacterium]